MIIISGNSYITIMNVFTVIIIIITCWPTA